MQYAQKERDPEWRHSKKCDFPDSRAKMSFIAKDQLLTRKEEQPEQMEIKQVFYARNLNTKDIEGTDCGSLDTKFMKNWKIAQDMKSNPHPKGKVPNLHFPYGDGINTEDYLPEHLRKAKQMAGFNKHRMKLINTVDGGIGSNYENLKRQATLEKKFLGDSTSVRAGENVNRSVQGGPPLLPSYHNVTSEVFKGDGQGNYQAEKNMEREAEVRRRVEEMMAHEDEEKYLSQRIPQRNNDNQGNALAQPIRENNGTRVRFQDQQDQYMQATESNGRQKIDYASLPQYSQPFQSSSNFVPNSLQYDRLAVSPDPTYNKQFVSPQADQFSQIPAELYNKSQEDKAYRNERSLPEQVSRSRSPNQEGDPPVAMAPFLRGQKGKEFTLEAPRGERLQHLNDFYTDFVGEQYKRRAPFTKDEYNYQKTVNHLKRNGLL